MDGHGMTEEKTIDRKFKREIFREGFGLRHHWHINILFIIERYNRVFIIIFYNIILFYNNKERKYWTDSSPYPLIYIR